MSIIFTDVGIIERRENALYVHRAVLEDPLSNEVIVAVAMADWQGRVAAEGLCNARDYLSVAVEDVWPPGDMFERDLMRPGEWLLLTVTGWVTQRKEPDGA